MDSNLPSTPATRILLYYLYTPLTAPQALAKAQQELCGKLNLTGRIIIAEEGINGTVGGSWDETAKYMEHMQAIPQFASMVFKESPGGPEHFPRLSVKVKREIAHLGLDPQKVTVHDGGTHLPPEQFHELLENRPKDLVVIDCRNDYESVIGTFEGAIKPDTKNFREFPAYVDAHAQQLQDKQVAMFCTGGVRCERATAYLKQKGIKNVFQLEGGIAKYAEAYPDGHFRGKLYVFDDRIAVPITEDVLTTCSLCATSCDDYTNCANPHCNKQFIVCPACVKTYKHTCSDQCKNYLSAGNAPPRKIWRGGRHKQTVTSE